MRRRRGQGSLFTNPMVIGALTVLVVLIAVGLAYNANTGLPFVPTYQLHVQASDASELQKGDDVDEGGALVGIVKSVTATRTKAGRPIALLNLSLYKSIEPLPSDTRFTVRLKGAIGLKYLAVTPGHTSSSFKNGATVRLSQEGTSVDFDQVLDMFTPKTRKGVTDSTIGLGEALAGHGYDLNRAIGALGPLLDDLQPVAANLSSKRTDLAGFFDGLENFSGALAPVAQLNATLFANLDTTFKAFASQAPALQAAIADSPGAEDAVIDNSPTIRPFLTDFASLLRQSQPVATELGADAPVLASVFATGRRTLPKTGSLDHQTVLLAQRLKSYAATPAVQQGLDSLTSTARALKKPLAFLAPVQSSCNYVTLFLRNVASALSEHVSQGGLLSFVQIAITDVPGNESGPSQNAYTTPQPNKSDSYGPIHSDAYPNTASPGEAKECSAGNEPFVQGAQTGNPPINVGTATELTKRAKDLK